MYSMASGIWVGYGYGGSIAGVVCLGTASDMHVREHDDEAFSQYLVLGCWWIPAMCSIEWYYSVAW